MGLFDSILGGVSGLVGLANSGSANRQANRIADQQREIAREAQARASEFQDRYNQRYAPLADTSLQLAGGLASLQNPYEGALGQSQFAGAWGDAAAGANDASSQVLNDAMSRGFSVPGTNPTVLGQLGQIRNRQQQIKAGIGRDLYLAGENERYRRGQQALQNNMALQGFGLQELGTGLGGLNLASATLGGLQGLYNSKSNAAAGAFGNVLGSLDDLGVFGGSNPGRAGGSTTPGTTGAQTPSNMGYWGDPTQVSGAISGYYPVTSPALNYSFQRY